MEEGRGRVGDRRDAELRGLPAVHELAAELEAPHAQAVAAARQAIDERRARLIAAEVSRSRATLTGRGRPGAVASWAAVPAPGDQRHRRDHPHQSRARPAARGRSRGGGRRRPADTQPLARPDSGERAVATPMSRGCCAS